MQQSEQITMFGMISFSPSYFAKIKFDSAVSFSLSLQLFAVCGILRRTQPASSGRTRSESENLLSPVCQLLIGSYKEYF